MMNKIKKCLQHIKQPLSNDSGQLYITACVIVLVAFLLFATVTEYLRLKIITEGVRDATQSAITSVVTENWDNSYDSLRGGYSRAMYLDYSNNWRSDIDKSAIYQQIQSNLKLNDKGGRYVKYIDANVEYILSNLSVTVNNTGFQDLSHSNNLNATVTLTITMPLTGYLDGLPDLSVPLKVSATFRNKF